MPIISISLILYVFFNVSLNCAQYIIVLDPADAERTLSDSFARGANIQCVEELKKRIEQMYDAQVVITRTPGVYTAHENHAQISNRLGANLYIHLSFFQETAIKPRIYIYQHTTGTPFTLITPIFCPYEQTHLSKQTITTAWGSKLYDALNVFSNTQYSLYPVMQVPCAPLIGIVAPAFIIEIGLRAAHDWHFFVEPLCTAFGTLIEL